MEREPLIKTASVIAFISAVLTIWVAFGGSLTEAQREAIMQFAAIVAPVIAAGLTALIGRMFVTPVSDPKIVTDAGEVVPLVRADSRSTGGSQWVH